MDENEYCKECGWMSKKGQDPAEHHWYCAAQDDATLLRKLVEKFRELYEKLR